MTDAEKAAEEFLLNCDREVFSRPMSGLVKAFLAGIAWARANPEQRKAEILKISENENT